MEASSRRIIITFTHTVYLKMMTHTAILSDNAWSWPFVLLWIFANTLMAQLRDAMQQRGICYKVMLACLLNLS